MIHRGYIDYNLLLRFVRPLRELVCLRRRGLYYQVSYPKRWRKEVD